MSYLVRRLLENTSNESFLAHSFLEHQPEEELLMNPVQMEGPNGSSAAADRDPSEPGNELSPFENEPLTDFSREEARAGMAEAIREVRKQFGRYCPLIINGKRIETEEFILSESPSHCSEIVARVAKAQPEHARMAVKGAVQAFPAWRDTPPEERAEVLRRTVEILRRRKYELAAWEAHEAGKSWREADADVAEGIDLVGYYAEEILRITPSRWRTLSGEANEFFYEPRGVAVVIPPWNFPLAIPAGMTAAALVTGNTAILKPAGPTGAVGYYLAEAFLEAGIPPGVLQFLPGSGSEIGPLLVSHPDVALIAFTGSAEVGLWINEAAARCDDGQIWVKKVIAEMGGKNAMIVDDDADLDEAIPGVLASAFGYQGQKCSACSRAIVLEPIYESFLKRLGEAAAAMRVGPAEDPASDMGPMINQQALDKVREYAAIARKEGRVVFEGDVSGLEGEGYYAAPMVVSDVQPEGPIFREEIFGPILAVVPARDFDQALELANDCVYALTGGIYSRSPDHLARARREFRVGNLYINRKITGAMVGRQPFGGFKLSGTGTQAGGPDYLLHFMLPRTVCENTLRRGFAPAPAPLRGE